MTKLVTVYGMTSENSRKVITEGLERVNGIYRVSITMSTRLVEIDFDEKTITLPEIKKIIHTLGYDPM
ncbi:MAG: cation transporter [Candidatus Cloacimonetes bacterium]|nr:cation transporter [Candidatus Cloacimonadota bacterium]